MRIYWFFIWTNLNPLHPRMLCDKIFLLVSRYYPNGYAEENFYISPMYFCCFIIISPLKRLGPFIWTNLNPLHSRILCAKFGWNWPSGSGEEDFLNFLNAFSLFRNYLPLEKGRALHLNKLESPWTKDALCQVWLKLALWFFLEKKIFKFSQWIFYLLAKGLGPSFKQTWIPFT